MSKSSKAKLQELEDLKKKLDLREKKLKTEKSKIEKERKTLEADKKKVTSEWKRLDKAKKKFEDDKELSSKKNASSSVKQGRQKSTSNKQFQDQFFEMKKKYDAENKISRDYKKKLAQLEVENKVLRNKVKNLSGKRRGKKDDKRLRQLMRENRELRKRLRKMMKEVGKRRRYYKRAIKVFRKNQDKWIKAQRNAFKDKKFIIKYVFLGDVKYIKQYQKPRKGRDKLQFKNRIRVKTKGGGETTVKDVEIVVLDADADTDDDSGAEDTNGDGSKKKKKKKKGGSDGGDDDGTDETDAKKKKKKKKKGAKSEAEEEEEIDAFLADMAKEFGIANDEVSEDEEDLKSDEEEQNLEDDDFENDDDDDDEKDEDNDKDDDGDGDDDDVDDLLSNDKDDSTVEAQLVYLRQEMDERANDLDKLKDIMTASDQYPDPKKEIEALIDGTIDERQKEMMKNLENLGGDSSDYEPIKESNDEWKKYLLNLSKGIIGNTEQINRLMAIINGGFLKELNGRIKDLTDVNNVYYDEEVTEDEERIDFGALKGNVDQRHSEIENDIQASQESMNQEDGDSEEAEDKQTNDDKIRELYQGLLTTNETWNALVGTSSTMYQESQTAKSNLIEQLSSKYSKLQLLMDKVDSLPSTVLS